MGSLESGGIAMTGRTVPYTPMLRLYDEVCKINDEDRLTLAEYLVRRPQRLVDDFLETVWVLEDRYDNTEAMRVPRRGDDGEDIWPEPRRSKFYPEIADGDDIADRLKRQGVLEVEGAPELSVEYADFELYVMRTTGGALFDRPRFRKRAPAKAGGALKVDVVMANRVDRTPVAAEVKVGDDKEPFSGLIQALTYLAHMVSPLQYKRLRDQLPNASFPNTDYGRGDAYVLLYRFGEKFDAKQGHWVDCPAKYHDALADAAAGLAAGLRRDEQLGEFVRSLVCLDLGSTESNHLTARLRWHENVGAS